MKDKEKQNKVFDILDKMELFQGQRAGRELWNNKPKEVQDKDISDFIKDINYIRSYLQDSVVLSMEEYEMLVNQYKNLEIKYSDLCDNYRLCKDANETLKQNIIITRKEIAEEFYDKVNENICVFQLENKNQEFTDGYAQAIADICGRLDQIAKQFGVETKE
ncbi:hypothetical protein [Intestinibacter sp.]|uniref:hypothetical protein n=1 Tax=Intestinibacter sp. TaxID=1965304 RepID=UPI002A75A11F|nr:hypothetical protein [Intestinibacter sp.]MDY2737292.1 hypothetical protein [Intestinibacter sp.]